jgi:hypothetical protein
MKVINKEFDLYMTCPDCNCMLGIDIDDISYIKIGNSIKKCNTKCCRCGYTLHISNRDIPTKWIIDWG